MAGDWLKMECSTPDKPEVLAITAHMGWDDPDLTVGKLFKLWRWFDQHTISGNAVGVTPALLDRVIGVTGLTLAMAKVGWIFVTEDGISLPNFDRHNGETAKNRALGAKRAASFKAKGGSKGKENQSLTLCGTKSNAVCVTSALPREEKRREDINNPLPPGGGDVVLQKPKPEKPKPEESEAGFEKFWQVWPKSDRKQAKGLCLKAWKKAGAERHAADILAHIEACKRSENWSKEGGQFIPAPLVYLNQKRWEGAELAGSVAAGESKFGSGFEGVM